MKKIKTVAAYKIQRVPYPGPQKLNGGRPPGYPILQLGEGESFFVPSRERNISAIRSLTSAIHRARHTFDLNIQWTPEKGGFRVHRLEGGYNGPA